ncbi:unnamed protein product [Didymodactylos carnosus]|uniref:Uncharacterized protein n=1 Tax=Didymodactylos carnosus TaxID=1234261 RepID=A0A815Y198_9BILA|nr:unnamed protein product [Didymodactylos carnosus]CAF4426351.1 unnamed protein product [Didymodactylos carnosus]
MRFTLFLIAFTLTVQECESTKDCKYKDGLFGRIDLTSVGLKNTPAFRNLPSTGQPDIYFYSYNPCYPFNEASCSDVAGCQNRIEMTLSRKRFQKVFWRPEFPEIL